MQSGVYLCPCCAAHLRVPPGMHAFRCNTCDATLVYVDSGGVRGLAQVPEPESDRVPVPYSVPRQRADRPQFDSVGLVHARTFERLQHARQVAGYWRSALVFSMLPVIGGPFLILYGWLGLVAEDPKWAEAALGVLLISTLFMVCCVYIARFVQNRLRLAESNLRYWQQRLQDPQ